MVSLPEIKTSHTLYDTTEGWATGKDACENIEFCAYDAMISLVDISVSHAHM